MLMGLTQNVSYGWDFPTGAIDWSKQVTWVLKIIGEKKLKEQNPIPGKTERSVKMIVS